MLTRIRAEEDGVAMVVALMVTFVVLMLSLVVMTQSVHSVQQSGYDRKRLTAITAAEAGIDRMYGYFQNTPASALTADPVATPVSVGTYPNTTTYDTTVTYYGNAFGTLACGASGSTCGPPAPPPAPLFSGTSYPSSAKVVSIGTSSDGTKRVMETFMVLHPVTAGTNGAIVTNSTTTFSGNFTISGVDSDIYVLCTAQPCNFLAPSGLESINGSIYVPYGSANIGTNVNIAGQVFARDAVTLNHPQLIVGGTVSSSTTSVIKTAGTVNGAIHYCSASGGTGPAGAVNDCPSPVPGTADPFPRLTYDTATWAATQSDGSKWFEVTPAATPVSQCSVAKNLIEAGVTPPAGYTGVVYYITDPTCVFNNSSNAGTINLNGDLAIVAAGGIHLGNHPTFMGVGGTRKVVLMAPWPSPSTSSPTCPAQGTTDGPYVVTVDNQVAFDNASTNVLVYAACAANMSNNNSSFSGQVIAQNATIGNLFSMNYLQMLIPGLGITGFKEDVSYIREVVCQNPASASC